MEADPESFVSVYLFFTSFPPNLVGCLICPASVLLALPLGSSYLGIRGVGVPVTPDPRYSVSSGSLVCVIGRPAVASPFIPIKGFFPEGSAAIWLPGVVPGRGRH